MSLSTSIENDLRAAFRAAAETIEPTPTPLSSSARASHSRRRWLVPAVAAAVVIAVGAPIVALTVAKYTAGPDIAAASAVQVDGARATVAGIGFPVPAGWTVAVVGHDATSVTACVAATPAADCDGVTLHIAVPDGIGNISPIPDPLTALTREGHPVCSSEQSSSATIPEILDQAPVDGRPAIHVGISCGTDGPQTAAWFVTDGSLAVSATPGTPADRAVDLVRGIDFADYAHPYGPEVMSLTAASSLPPTR